MPRRYLLLPISVLLFGMALLVVAMDHQGYLELCVCVVNALARGITALGVALLFACAALVLEKPGDQVTPFLKAATYLQVIWLLCSLFFFIQYVYFVLEIVR
ncbi:MAG: hypothetical protein IPK99_15655 [Flavobacteriales bacterium]|nr:hypothetical protein [Flavobacteriales bacterium]